MADYSNWTKEQEKFLIDNLNVLSLEEMSEKLDRPLGGVKSKIYTLRKQNKAAPSCRRWTKKKTQYLWENQSEPVGKLSEKLNRSAGAIYTKLQDLKNRQNCWDLGEYGCSIALISMCIKEDMGQSLKELAERLAKEKNIPVSECMAVLDKLKKENRLGYYDFDKIWRRWKV